MAITFAKMKRFVLIILGIQIFGISGIAQDDVHPYVPLEKDGHLFITWGYNRAFYDNSDIHFQGDGYDFTLFDAKAQDMPEEFDTKVYLNPGQLTIPQFNFRVGYYIKPDLAISLGWDHMKYRLITTQLVRIDGYISEEKYFDEAYTGTFNDEYILYSGRFMDFHHSDGFNFIRAAIEKRKALFSDKSGLNVLAFNGAASVGVMMPWTDFTFFGERYRNWAHVAGYGVSLSAGLRYEFLRHFFFQVNAQVGYTHLPDILLEDEKPSRAEQKIVFFERSFALGGYIPLVRKNKS
ncbi:MAG: hypothetical protein RL220_2107 [Bacteroidota bacterium]